ncbi:uncharacterized protein J8A68_000855 [[Candida] subhashii]|uniref:Uncharacterized protein n=1 Tax=[Candida] subhashii TaxID=561895 RepID=A0A8J5QQT3_9ASCO|nr:uncharacterized protein J8A68_000855 [[Candida] subhashii]KAG7665649.1 hypothetical protein J8A68_000855 [[Candida] subhashii]
MSLIGRECSQRLIRISSNCTPSIAANSISQHIISNDPTTAIPSKTRIHPQRGMIPHNKATSIKNTPIGQQRAKASSHILFKQSPRLSNLDQNPNKDKHKKEVLEKKANLGSIVEQLKTTIPNILEKSLEKSIISPHIHLRICPSQFDENYLPNLKGHVTYYTTCKTIQLFLTSVILSPKVKLHIQSIRIHDGPDPQAMLEDTTKIFVRWSTCAEGCPHLLSDEDNGGGDFHSTSHAHLGSHRWSKSDTMKLFKNHHGGNGEESNAKLSYLTGALGRLPKTLMGLTKEPKKLERVISGLFIFELNDDNTKILVHTIENVDVVERFQTEDVDSSLRVC